MTKAQTDVDAAREALRCRAEAARQPPAAVQGRRARAKARRRSAGRATRRRRPVRHRAAAPAGAADGRPAGTDAAPRRRRSRRRGGITRRAGAGRLRRDPQPDHRRRHRSAALSGRDGERRRAAADRDGRVEGRGARQLAQDQARNVKVGNEATMTPTDGSELVTGTVTIVSPAVDPNSTTVQVWVQADNPGERLRAGAVGPRVDRRRHASKARRSCRRRRSCPTTRADRSSWSVDDKNIAHDDRRCRSACASRRWCRCYGRRRCPVERVQSGERVGRRGLEDKAQGAGREAGREGGRRKQTKRTKTAEANK